MRERRTSRKRVGRGGRGEEGKEGNRLWRWGWAERRDQELEREVRMDERRVGYKSLAGTRAMGREGGREGGGEGREGASRAHRSACSFPGMLQWAGTQQRVTVLYREWRRVKYSMIDVRRGWGRE